MLYYNSIFLLLMQFETFMMLLLQKPHVLLHIIFDSTLVENDVMATILQACLYSKRSGRLVVVQILPGQRPGQHASLQHYN